MRNREGGSAVAGFVMVLPLLLILVLGVIQLALTLHVRNVLTDVAGEAARWGATWASTDDEAASRARTLADVALADGYVTDIGVNRKELTTVVAAELGTPGLVSGTPLELIEVTMRAPVPVIGAIVGALEIEVRGRAVVEAPW